MAASLKRKSSPSLEEDAESAKRRFAEAEEQPPQPEDEDDEHQVNEAEEEDEQAQCDDATTQPPEASPPPADDRAARFAALRARHTASRKSNLDSTRAETRSAAINPAQLHSLNRKRDVAAHKLLKTEVESSGEDFERKRAWDWTVEESEKWDERLAEKKARRDGVAFQDYAREAGKVYDRQIREMEKGAGEGRRGEYEKEKEEAIEKAVRSGGLEIVETESGELIAVDKDGSYLSTDPTASTGGSFGKKPSKDALDRLVADIRKAEEVRLKKRKERGRADPMDENGDVTYINEKNKQFNMKLARFYDKYTSEIRDSFERGTAI
jgi:pre-mRNA-splicing factor SYF2